MRRLFVALVLLLLLAGCGPQIKTYARKGTPIGNWPKVAVFPTEVPAQCPLDGILIGSLISDRFEAKGFQTVPPYDVVDHLKEVGVEVSDIKASDWQTLGDRVFEVDAFLFSKASQCGELPASDVDEGEVPPRAFRIRLMMVDIQSGETIWWCEGFDTCKAGKLQRLIPKVVKACMNKMPSL